MITSVTASSDPERTWQQKSLLELEQALGLPFELWESHQGSDWSLQASGDCKSKSECESEDNSKKTTSTIEGNAEVAIMAMFDYASSTGKTTSNEQSSGRHLLVIPLRSGSVATTSVETDNPELLIKLANLGGRFCRQEEEIARLCEENDFFLKQVSDDFEELTFLRAMAERLGLGDETHTIEQLITASLPELGKSSHAESLHFIHYVDFAPKLLSTWREHGTASMQNEEQQLLQLISDFQLSAKVEIVIKNGFGLTEQGHAFQGLRDFIIVPVGKTTHPLGWFIAINRKLEDPKDLEQYPEWRLNQHEFGTSEASLLSTAAAMTSSHANNLSLFQEREQLLVNVVRTLVSAVEAKDQYTSGHSERVALFAKRLSEQVGYSEEQSELLYLTGLLHDIGKIAISDAVLNKPGKLSDEEFSEIQRHPEEGWTILNELKQLEYVLPGVLHHHERMDGKGYPDGLQGQDIPLDGRVLAVADAYDAMTSDRAYRKGMPHEKAISILREGAGSQWDADAVQSFLEIEDEIIEIRNTYQPRIKPNRQPTVLSTLTD